jgi:hypothetical protein
LFPQLAAPWSWHVPAGSGMPVPTGEQVPLPFAAQELQLPQGPLLQQTPSVQKVLRHSAPEPQAAPSDLPVAHTPDWQVSPLTQLAVLVQAIRQLPVPQT